MTVLTKPISEMKKKSPLAIPLVQAEQPVDGAEVVVVPGKRRDQDVENLGVPFTLGIRSHTRVTSATTVCLFLVGLLVMSVGIVGGIYLYQHCARRPLQRLRGFLNVPYNNTDGRHLYYHLDSLASRQVASPEISSKDTKKSGYFYEKFEADGSYERIDVPEFNGGRPGQFIHDWHINKTGIVDVDGRRCFVIPLDRDAVVFLPSFVIDLARKMASRGSDVKVIVKTMRVAFPPLTDMSTVGENIARECSGMKIYSLVRANLGAIFKRNAEEPVVFGSFSGKTMKVEIVNYQEMVEAENDGVREA
ncbi:integral membrane protein 2C [Frankliniella occidentalis]|uniref:Integral membrane protein 2 n=1 Tax=Frankliniella occidentalis TaxID=133901 RepID=A0A6J1THW6_FRAOC|nr:integral membrane protein 2C [Frankliniella occidentalis]